MQLNKLLKLLFGSKKEAPAQQPMKKYLIAGLGNIGEKYAETRHNIGFKILDELASKESVSFESEKLGAIATFKFKQDEDQIECSTGEQTIQPVHESQSVGDDTFAAQVVLLGVFVHDLRTHQIHSCDHPCKAEAHQGSANDCRDKCVGEKQRDER